MAKHLNESMKKIDCPCQLNERIDRDDLLHKFKEIRQECAALREILVPDSVWSDFQKNATDLPDEVGHQYKVLGALQHGILSKITAPIHRYLMNGNTPKTLKNGYKEDLIESWMGKRTPLERHRKARGHEGKINELLCAYWLEKQGWEIENLEALGGQSDIDATSPDNIPFSVEVKFTGQEDEKFEEITTSIITRKAIAGKFSIKAGYNFFLLKAYQAACQLSKSEGKRLAIIVFSHQSWGFNSMPINDGWIKKGPIEFLKNADNWDNFFAEKVLNDYPDIKDTLENKIKNLDELWVVVQQGDLEYSLEKVFKF